ncbi:MAG: hypothetical protein V1844_13175 [Pseudomonadota bacterium]
MIGKQFDQQLKVAIVENAKEIAFKEAFRRSGVRYTTVNVIDLSLCGTEPAFTIIVPI